MKLTLLLVLVALVAATLSRKLDIVKVGDDCRDDQAYRCALMENGKCDGTRCVCEPGNGVDAQGKCIKDTIDERKLLLEELSEILEARDDEGIDLETKSTGDKCGLNTDQVVPSTHTACISQQSANLIHLHAPNDDEKKQLVDYHNTLRRQVSPLAGDMMKLSWNDELAMLARKWASQCNWNHDVNSNRNIPGRYKVGQNMQQATNQVFTWIQVIDSWHSEVKDFKYGEGSINGKDTGHYTQVVAAKTSLVGCAAAKCKRYPEYPDNNEYDINSVCNYAVGGNLRILGADGKPISDSSITPYTKAEKSCSMCQKCENNLCVCEESATTTSMCFNGGKHNIADCTCDCSNAGKYAGLKCDTYTCEDVDEYYWKPCSHWKTYENGYYCRYSNFKKNCCKSCS